MGGRAGQFRANRGKTVPRGWVVRIDPSGTDTGNIVDKAAEQAEPGAPTVTVIGHPRSGRIKIKQRRRG
ncbi:hypothetical protein [Kitasatospora brasiliensis]|uniref:hypothetical protein n=1 Tax=Kitasatospora brasiliensis TaxID=3058040 RepID=UPI0029309EF4|nr:hypothetical protein [Kitasatospora sp. K002]